MYSKHFDIISIYFHVITSPFCQFCHKFTTAYNRPITNQNKTACLVLLLGYAVSVFYVILGVPVIITITIIEIGHHYLPTCILLQPLHSTEMEENQFACLCSFLQASIYCILQHLYLLPLNCNVISYITCVFKF